MINSHRGGGNPLVSCHVGLWHCVKKTRKPEKRKLTTLDVKLLGPSSAREIGTFTLKTKGCLLLQEVRAVPLA